MTSGKNEAFAAGFLAVALLTGAVAAVSEELPVPSFKNAMIISIEHSPRDAAEVEYIKKNIPFGLYAWPSFSVTALTPSLAWRSDWTEAAKGIQGFMNEVQMYLDAARAQSVLFHLVLTSGLARGIWVYKDAKNEDVRNGQWYNDNNLASDQQISDPKLFDRYVFGTLSRYARKLRANLEAKSKAALAFLRQKMAEDDSPLVAVSGWGEADLNYNRIQHDKTAQDWFCDFSPFAVLEFRDWILHAGFYDDATGKYKGQGFETGGAKFRGASGLAKFNAEYGTNFSAWDLRYFHWSLDDDYDADPADTENNDPKRIPYARYAQGQMMPSSGPNYIPGGFDPPRAMEPGVRFWELWNHFRETMVANFVKDMARWAAAAGIPADRWFSHQIPGDYLFGTWAEAERKNARYYASASPLWTAFIQPFGRVGVTLYDIKFPDVIARSTEHSLKVLKALNEDWAIMEYDAETYPLGLNVGESVPDFILAQYLRVYDANAHLINFWRWWEDTNEHRIKGMNKEIALRDFVRKVRDKARGKNLDAVFDPPRLTGFRAKAEPGIRNRGSVALALTGKIWEGEKWEWKDWGDFDHFEIYRGTSKDFPIDAGYLVAKTREYSYRDDSVQSGGLYFYKARAMNVKSAAGAASKEIRVFVPLK